MQSAQGIEGSKVSLTFWRLNRLTGRPVFKYFRSGGPSVGIAHLPPGDQLEEDETSVLDLYTSVLPLRSPNHSAGNCG